VRWSTLVLSALAVAMGCSAAAVDHEALGDRAYVSGAYDGALVEYRLALLQQPATGTLRGKAAAAALAAGELDGAVELYLALAHHDNRRKGEAADGLERVVRLALAGNDQVGLRKGIEGLRTLADRRALTAFGGQLATVLGEAPRGADVLTVLPYAAAAAPDARTQDSVMFVYAAALGRAGRCESALTVYEGLVRRQRAPGVVEAAKRGAASCALALGRRALEAGEPRNAEAWFQRAVGHAGDTDLGRAAYIGLGDVMFARGAFGEAVEAYQRAMFGASVGDSLAAVARERLNMISDAGTVFR